jgi:hypothetical protein
MPPASHGVPLIALVACRVLESELDELAGTAAHLVHREFLPMGLHDRPAILRAELKAAIGRAEADPRVKTVVLGFGLCGLALVEVSPTRCLLVAPRAHDCITLLLGSKERYAARMAAEPGTYWYSRGWNRGGLAPGPERFASLKSGYTEKFGAEQAAALLELERENFAAHTRAGYVDWDGRAPAADHAYAGRCAATLGWPCDYHRGDPALLHDLLFGPWDEARFLRVAPGERVAHAPDESIIRTAPALAPGKTASG